MDLREFFRKFSGTSFTYDDLIFLPGMIEFSLNDMMLKTQLTKEIELNIPMVSSPMDTVTESELATSIALQGGVGLIHYNMAPEEQYNQVRKVKRFKHGCVVDPITLPPKATIQDVINIRREYGYSIVPITEDGESNGKLLGMITKYDYSTFSTEFREKSVQERMIPIERLSVATLDELRENGVFNLEKANERLLESHSAALPVIDHEGRLCYLVTLSDLEKHKNYPNAAMDRSKSLLVGAAVETWEEKAYERIEALKDIVDIIVFDTAQGHSAYEVKLIKWVKSQYPQIQVIGGNVVTKDGCQALVRAGADAIRVGMGSGSICTTQEVGGGGRGQASAIYECAEFCRKENVPVIADGGIRKSADIVKALSLGASVVMLGSLLACTNEAPGETQIKDGIRLKAYRGMGSLGAMEQGSAARYGAQENQLRIPEGVSGLIPSRGAVSEWIPCLLQGLRQGMHKLGYSTIRSLHQAIDQGEMKCEMRSSEAKREGEVHGLFEYSLEKPTTSQKVVPQSRTFKQYALKR